MARNSKKGYPKSDVRDLNEQEKVFLAGAVKAIFLAGGSLDKGELDDLDRIIEGLGFTDFDEHLELFERDVTKEGDFEFLARNIFHAPSTSLITRILWDLALQKGAVKPEAEEIIKSIQTWWKE